MSNPAAETLAALHDLFNDDAVAVVLFISDEAEIAANPLWTETASVVR